MPGVNAPGTAASRVTTPDVTVAIIGTGFGGIGMTARLRRAGFGDVVLLPRLDSGENGENAPFVKLASRELSARPLGDYQPLSSCRAITIRCTWCPMRLPATSRFCALPCNDRSTA